MITETVDPTSLFAGSPPPSAPIPPAGSEPVAPVQTDPLTGPAAAELPGEPTTDAPPVDGAGVPFDPIRHIPTKHPRTDRWMPRRQPRENGNGAGPIDPPPSASFIDTEPEPTPGPNGNGHAPAVAVPGADVCTVMADLHCRAFYGLTAALLSEEWLPDKPEHIANRDVLAAFYRAKNMTPDSPGWALAAQLAAYGGKRFTMPKTQTRLGMLKAWVVAKYAGWRGARRSAAIQSATS